MKRMKFVLAAAVIFAGIAGFASDKFLATTGLRFGAPTVSDTASVPTPEQGDILFKRTSGTQGTFHGWDGTDWVSFTSSANAAVPIGSILPFGGTTAPTGYVLCDGTSYSTVGTYADLFATIGYSYGGSSGLLLNCVYKT